MLWTELSGRSVVQDPEVLRAGNNLNEIKLQCRMDRSVRREAIGMCSRM